MEEVLSNLTSFENAWLKSVTLLTSQVPISPHLARLSSSPFTQSHEAFLNVVSVSGLFDPCTSSEQGRAGARGVYGTNGRRRCQRQRGEGTHGVGSKTRTGLTERKGGGGATASSELVNGSEMPRGRTQTHKDHARVPPTQAFWKTAPRAGTCAPLRLRLQRVLCRVDTRAVRERGEQLQQRACAARRHHE